MEPILRCFGAHSDLIERFGGSSGQVYIVRSKITPHFYLKAAE
jgi:hypothetical protein